MMPKMRTWEVNGWWRGFVEFQMWGDSESEDRQEVVTEEITQAVT
jgi:hypothetical protein